MRAFLLAVVVVALLAILPNGLWLARSTAVVRNQAAEPVSLAIVTEDEVRRAADLGTLAAGEARFLWLDAVGEATLFVEVGGSGEPTRHCAEYVEGAMYHVTVTVQASGAVTCRAELPFLDRLLLLELLRAQFQAGAALGPGVSAAPLTALPAAV